MISLLSCHAGEPGKCSYRTYICCGGSFNVFLWLAMLFSACLLIAMGLLNVNTYIVSRIAQQAALVAESVTVSNANAMQQLSQQVNSIETSLDAAPASIKGAAWFVNATTAVDTIQGEQPAVHAHSVTQLLYCSAHPFCHPPSSCCRQHLLSS